MFKVCKSTGDCTATENVLVSIGENFHPKSQISSGDPIPSKMPLFGAPKRASMSPQLPVQIGMQSPGGSTYYFTISLPGVQLPQPQ